jgi:hypothetical protein
MTATQFGQVLRILSVAGVEFVIVGGYAGVAAAGRPKDFEAIGELELIRDRGSN